ncbi:hypothetical protein [Streptomyces sp. NPDC001508]
MDVDCDVLTDGDSEFKIVILTAAPGSAGGDRFRHALTAAADRTHTPAR